MGTAITDSTCVLQPLVRLACKAVVRRLCAAIRHDSFHLRYPSCSVEDWQEPSCATDTYLNQRLTLVPKTFSTDHQWLTLHGLPFTVMSRAHQAHCICHT